MGYPLGLNKQSLVVITYDWLREVKIEVDKNSKIDVNEKVKKQYFYYLNAKHDEYHLTALEFALDIRKFEIGLYWKRATYFWAFIAAIFTGFFALKAGKSSINPYYFLLLGILGYIFSFSWYMVSRASKFWQQNWEMHVDMLEDEFIGSIYKIVKNPDNLSIIRPLDSYACSVTKINQLISIFLSFAWIYWICDALNDILPYGLCIIYDISAAISISFLLSIIIIKSTKSTLDRKQSCNMFIVRK